MERENLVRIKRLVLAAMFAAVIFLTTAYLMHIPTGFNGGYIHLGDAFIYFAACILPWPYAMGAAAVGAGLSDALTGGIVWLPATVVIKPLLTLYFTSRPERFVTRRNVAAVFLAGITGLAGYYLAGAVITGSFLAPLMTLPVDAIQPAASGLLFVLLGLMLDRIGLKKALRSI